MTEGAPESLRCDEAAPDALDSRSRSCGFLTGIGIVVFVLCLILGGAIVGFRWYQVRSMSASEAAEMRRFMTEPVRFPAEWARVEP